MMMIWLPMNISLEVTLLIQNKTKNSLLQSKGPGLSCSANFPNMLSSRRRANCSLNIIWQGKRSLIGILLGMISQLMRSSWRQWSQISEWIISRVFTTWQGRICLVGISWECKEYCQVITSSFLLLIAYPTTTKISLRKQITRSILVPSLPSQRISHKVKVFS